MKFLVVIAVAVAVASAAPVDESSAKIEHYSYNSLDDRTFTYSYKTDNGISGGVSGHVKNFESEHPAITLKGGYKYIAPDGTPIEILFIADEYGFQPKGDHLPVAPPVPEAIARSLEWIAAHPPSDPKHTIRH